MIRCSINELQMVSEVLRLRKGYDEVVLKVFHSKHKLRDENKWLIEKFHKTLLVSK